MDAKRNRFVYLIFAGDDLNPFYVGVGHEKTKTNRTRREYSHINDARRGAWKSNKAKHKFIVECLESGVQFSFRYERGLTTDEAHKREIELIRHYGRRDLGTGCLFNACAGGWGSREKSPSEIVKARAFRHTEEVKRRIAAKHLGMKHSDVSKAKIKAARAKQIMPCGERSPYFGKGSQSPEAIRQRDATRRYRARKRGEDVPFLSRVGKPGRKLSREMIEQIAAKNRGQKRTAEARERMSKASNRKGNPRPHTEESKAKMRAVKLGKRASEATKAKMRETWARRRELATAATITHNTSGV